jgi:hypothetical protein
VLGPEVIWNVPAGTLESRVAPCPDGETALGPSFYLDNASCQVSISRQFRVTSWELEVFCPAGASSPNTSLRAVCLRVAGAS